MAVGALNRLINHITPKRETVRSNMGHALTAATLVTALPPYRMAGSLAMRSLLLLTSTFDSVCAYRDANREAAIYMNEPDLNATYRHAARVAISALGLAGFVKGQPMLIVLSLVADSASRVLPMIKIGQSGENLNLALKELFIILSNSLMIGAMVTGSWPMVVLAASLHAAIFTVYVLDDLIEGRRNYPTILRNALLLSAHIAITRQSIPASEYTALPPASPAEMAPASPKKYDYQEYSE